MAWMASFGIFCSSTLLACDAYCESHVSLSLVSLKTTKFFLSVTVVAPREASDHDTERTEIDTLHKMRVEASGNWLPRLAALLDGGSQAIPVCAQGNTSNRQYCSKSRRSICQNGLPGLGASTESSIVELVKSDKWVDIVHQVTMLTIKSTDK